MSDLNWQALYSAALAESEPKRLSIKIEVAQRAIRHRLDENPRFGY